MTDSPTTEALVARLRSYDKHNHRGQYAVLVHAAADALEHENWWRVHFEALATVWQCRAVAAERELAAIRAHVASMAIKFDNGQRELAELRAQQPVGRCDAADPEFGQCILKKGHPGGHEGEANYKPVKENAP